MTQFAPRISVLPDSHPLFATAVTDSGGVLTDLDDNPDGLVVGFNPDRAALKTILDARPSIRWVQLPSAGIESYMDTVAAYPGKIWTSAKGAYAPPVGEHALALTLALLRRLPERVRAISWGPQAGTSLHGLNVLVVGAGGIGVEIVRLMKAFNTNVTVVRRQNIAVPGADRTVTTEALAQVLPDADVVVLAAALTTSTRGLLGAPELALLKPSAVLVNIARGGLINTDALCAALAADRLAGAGLDVTYPEPLPDGHPLWAEPKALITPHTADTMEMVVSLLAARVAENVRRLARGQELSGVVDPAAGY
ncbi:NAD(P)-dependent oxidoreductase [Arthrobacter sp. H35-D1]|uniref:NAD(P)-dependent oxidoreductase n=1 Tax=Arthrobacter sp. H35-D1 TaxID=3046202 RepID=UPI0024B8DE75|nr:NAD(P)-dependent oxidoreductase [Arthrobacter sp. H35-D1]MDJ0315452.1 NAD(P)-dependent oxidoreductase [Arthrobacter sp. H35-D1]